jgi:hypothetical protein
MLQELMNLSLQCLGAIRILSTDIEQSRKVKWTTSIHNQVNIEKDGFAEWALRKTFSFAAKRMIQHIVGANSPHNLDPARHIVESFPMSLAMLNQTWLAAHWAVLGDPDLHPFHKSTKNQSLASIHNPDERISILSCLIPYFPSTLTETDLEGRSVLHIASRLGSIALFDCVLGHCDRYHGLSLAHANHNGAIPLHNAARFR